MKQAWRHPASLVGSFARPGALRRQGILRGQHDCLTKVAALCMTVAAAARFNRTNRPNSALRFCHQRVDLLGVRDLRQNHPVASFSAWRSRSGDGMIPADL
jgi:hypothetical protein